MQRSGRKQVAWCLVNTVLYLKNVAGRVLDSSAASMVPVDVAQRQTVTVGPRWSTAPLGRI